MQGQVKIQSCQDSTPPALRTQQGWIQVNSTQPRIRSTVRRAEEKSFGVDRGKKFLFRKPKCEEQNLDTRRSVKDILTRIE